MRRRAVAVAWALLLLACDHVSGESIEQWKSTEKGPQKLEGALTSHSVEPGLRAAAALALVDIGHADTVDQAITAMPASERAEVSRKLVPLYATKIEKGSVTEARDARDGLFALRGTAPADLQKEIDAALLPAVTKDLRAGRAAGGRYSIDKILMALGPAAAPVLVEVLREPAAPYPAIVEVLNKVADPSTREAAGQALVARAAKLPEIPPPLYRALGSVGGKAVIDYLEGKITKGHERDAVLAAQALQQGPRMPSLGVFAMQVAGDQRANKAVRDEMFGVLEYVATPEAKEGAIRFIASDPEELVRYRAYETALAIGKAEAIASALEAFPSAASFKRDDVVDFLVKDIQKLGATTVRPTLVKTLGSRSSLARMTAILALEAVGTADDAPAVAKLSNDKGSVKGFPSGATVGHEATRVAAILQGKASGGKP